MKLFGGYATSSKTDGFARLGYEQVIYSVIKEPKELYEWAELFKATTWEEIRMLAEKNEYIADTVVTLRQLTADEKIRMQCQAREDYEHDKASYIRQGYQEGEHIVV